MPVTFVPTPPRYLALPRVLIWLPNDVFLPLTSHWRPIGPAPLQDILRTNRIKSNRRTRHDGSSSDLLFGHRIVRLAALHVAALLDQVADLVRRDRQLALGADIQGG